MASYPSHRRSWIALVAGAVQTVVAAVAGAIWLASGGIAAGAVLFGSWAALALALMTSTGAAGAIATLSTPSEKPTGDQAPPEAGSDIGRTLKLGALLPLCQTAAGAAIVAVASLGGFTPTEDVLVGGAGIGGAVGTFAAITGAAYLAMALGVLLALITVVPALMIRRAARRRTPKRSRGPVLALAVIVLALFPMSIAAVLAIAEPSGSPRSAAWGALLTVLGFDFSDQGYTVEHWGWLWTARIFGAVMVAAVAAALLASRRRADTARR
jgi:hypothetical protein